MFDASLVVNDCGDVLESMGMLAEAPVLLLGVPGLVKIVVETTRVPEMASALVPNLLELVELAAWFCVTLLERVSGGSVSVLDGNASAELGRDVRPPVPDAAFVELDVMMVEDNVTNPSDDS